MRRPCGLAGAQRVEIPPNEAGPRGNRSTLDVERIRRHVPRHHAAGRHIGALAHPHRRDQRGVGADERPRADLGAALLHAVEIAGDGARADVGRLPHRRVADVGEVVHLCALADARLLDLDEVADVHIRPQRRAGPEAGVRPDDRAFADLRVLQVAEAADVRALRDRHARADHHVRLDDHIAADPRVERQEHGFGRDERRPVRHGGAAIAALEDRLHLSQLRAVVDAQHLLQRAYAVRHAQAFADGEAHQIGQVVFALGVGGADLRQRPPQVAVVAGDDAGVDERQRTLFGRGVRLLPDGGEIAAGVEDEPPVAAGVGGVEAERRQRRARRDGRGEPGQRSGQDQRHVAVKDQSGSLEAFEGSARGEQRMGGAKPLRLVGDGGFGEDGARLRLHQGRVRRGDHANPRRTKRTRGGERMAEKGAARRRVHHLRQRRLHPRAEPGGKDDDGKRGRRLVGHGYWISSAGTYPKSHWQIDREVPDRRAGRAAPAPPERPRRATVRRQNDPDAGPKGCRGRRFERIWRSLRGEARRHRGDTRA